MKRFVKVLISVCFLFIFFSHIFSNGIAFSDAHIWSIENYKIIPELKGQTFQIKNVDISRKEFLKMIRNPLSFSLLSNAGPIAGLVNNQKELVIFSLTEFEAESEFLTISPTNLKHILSNNIGMKYVFSYVDDRLENRIIIADYDNDTLIIMEYDGYKIEIKNALKFNDEHFLDNFKVICAYSTGNSMKVICSIDERIYIFEPDLMKLTQTKIYNGWRTLYGYTVNRNKKEDIVYLYQINSNNILRKYDLLNNKVIYKNSSNNIPIKGNIIKLTSEESDLIYILTEFGNKNILYQINENILNLKWYTDTFEDFTELKNVNDMYYFITEHGKSFLILFDSNVEPLKLINPAGGICWKELQPENEPVKINEERKKDTKITKVITDIAKWDHPTKAVFKKYEYNLTKIEFTQNNTYPIFYINIDDYDRVFHNDSFLEELAKNNGYWDFAIEIGNKSLEVICNKKLKKIENKIIVIKVKSFSGK